VHELVVGDRVIRGLELCPGRQDDRPRIVAIDEVVLHALSRFLIAISLPAGGVVYVVAIYLIRAVDPEEWRLARDGLLARLRSGRAA